MGTDEKITLSPSSLFEIERSCIHILHLGFGISVQRLARWSKFDLIDGMVAGCGAFIFFISDGRVAYVLWHYPRDGKLSYPDVEIVPDFMDLKLPEGVVWERASEQMNEADLTTQAVA